MTDEQIIGPGPEGDLGFGDVGEGTGQTPEGVDAPEPAPIAEAGAAPAAEAEAEAAPAAAAPGLHAFLRSTPGRIVLIVAAVVMLLVVVGIVGFILLGTFVFDGGQTQVGPLPGAAATSTVPASKAASETTTAAAGGVPKVENREIFTPRDPFMPVHLPKTATRTAGSGDPDVLVLEDIVTENGVRKAVLALGSETYYAAAGERLGSTPWKVVKVGTSSVTMLYGDTQVVLTIGQGMETK